LFYLLTLYLIQILFNKFKKYCYFLHFQVKEKHSQVMLGFQLLSQFC